MHGDRSFGHPLLDRLEALAAERDATLAPGQKKTRGVVHTPAALARWMARATDRALGAELGRTLGSDDVVIVDPATGPGVFVGAVLETASVGAPRALVGLDVDGRALAQAREALGPAAHARGWPLVLAQADALASLAPHPALEDDDVVRVVIGNPPWAGRSANRANVADLLDDFRRGADGASLGERKIGVLSDDYVRFVRWSCEVVRRARRGGVVALVTNASYLDGPVHRGMRAAMRSWFDRIEVIDLGGSALVARSGARDENVFGVRPGAAIVIASRRPGPEPRAAMVEVQRVRGSRAEKLAWLSAGSDHGTEAAGSAVTRSAVTRTPATVSASAPESPWITGTRTTPSAYFSWPSLAQWMPFHREGVQTNRDDLVIARDRAALLERLERFASGLASPPTTAHWSADQARAIARALLDDPRELDRHLRPIAYRPLDDRVVLTHPALCHRARPELLRAVDASTLVLLTARKDRGDRAWACFGATTRAPDNCWLSTRSSCRTRAFPTHDPGGAPNLDRSIAELDPESFVHWALAWMACSVVREACEDALHADFPRVPIPEAHLERQLAEIVAAGSALAQALRAPGSLGRPAAAQIGHHALPPGPGAGAIAAALARIDAVVGPSARSLLSA